MNVWPLLASIAIGYLLGNFQTGLVVGWASRKIDLRKHGSGSTGATNALRTLGLASALITFLGDLAKGMLASVIGLALAGEAGQLAASLCVVLGHVWPVFFHFHGGKGVSTSVGALILVAPVPVACCMVVSIALMALTRYVSLGNIVGELCFAVYALVFGLHQGRIAFAVISALVVAVVVFSHRANIARLIAGKESRLSFKKAGKA